MKNNTFQFIDIFKIKSGFYNKKPIEKSQYANIPFIGATASSNGITGYFSIDTIKESSKTGGGRNEALESKLFPGKCIAVTNNGSVGYGYYQPYSFTCSHDVNPLYLLTEALNKDKALYLVTSIEQQRVCFEYARKWRPKRMRKSKLVLPVDSSNSPDYEYMELYIQKIRAKKEDRYIECILQRYKELKNTPEPVALKRKDWGEFFMEELLLIKSGVRLTKADQLDGNMPFIGASDSNNGITGFISNVNKSLDKNTLGVNYNGSVAESFYHPYEAIFSDDVKRISFKKTTGNKYLYLFLKGIILQQKNKYQYGYKFNSSRMTRQKLSFPLNAQGEPDYEYMEQYIKYLEYKKLKTYLEFKRKI